MRGIGNRVSRLLRSNVLGLLALFVALSGTAVAVQGADTASQDAKADKSAKGKRGPRGPAGPQGPQGPQGPAGANGTNGTNGTNGSTGGVVKATTAGSTNSATFSQIPGASLTVNVPQSGMTALIGYSSEGFVNGDFDGADKGFVQFQIDGNVIGFTGSQSIVTSATGINSPIDQTIFAQTAYGAQASNTLTPGNHTITAHFRVEDGGAGNDTFSLGQGVLTTQLLN